MINIQVEDLIQESARRIEAAAPADVPSIRSQPAPLIGFSDSMAQRHEDLKAFLFNQLYRHFRVVRMVRKSQTVVQELFDAFFETPQLMPEQPQSAAAQGEARHGTAGRARAVADYIAGMTDRFAIEEYRRLFRPEELS